ncbi:glutamate--cysteine ligase, partial [Acidimicrobiaceae bacterium USS-CC1]|nr:glutamate--cysteine ligase [Acidiferrimicrobium australe]
MVASPPASMDALADDLERLDAAAVTAGVEALAESGTPLDELLDAMLLPAWDRVDARCRAGEADGA